jgi:voltage-gated potassium channel
MRFYRNTYRERAILSITFVLLVLVVGTIGYHKIEGWRLFDSFYMTVITLTTIGFQEVYPLTENGRIFTMVLVFFGLGVVFYAINNGIKAILEGELQGVFERRRLDRMLKSMKNHFIVCGYGRMGRIICREFQERKVPFVVIEKQPQKLDVDDKTIILQGDATSDELLKKAGIERARGLISVLPTDAQNLYVVLSARGLNPNLFIVARVAEEGAEEKLLRAGASKVISPYHIGALRIAHAVLKPAVVDFIEFATKTGHVELQMEEVPVSEGSSLVGKTIHQAGIGRELGVIVVAIKRGSGEMKFNPTHSTVIKAGDTLIVIGEVQNIKKLEALAGLKTT